MNSASVETGMEARIEKIMFEEDWLDRVFKFLLLS
jgi:hypothetical protein